MTDPWVLCVDDEPMVLEGLDLQLSFDYTVRTATGGEDGLNLLREHPDCAVIISDMRMPGMNGAQFLTAAREVTPDSTRMLLTGYSDIDDAITAINEGGLFRFLTKPTPPNTLQQAVQEATRQWQLIQSERVLLEQTLHGAAQALIEALEIASPAAFSRARRVESASRHVATELGIKPVWEVTLAGLLLRLGWIAIPPASIDKYLNGTELDSQEATMFEATYATSARLVGRIPRLDGVAAIISQAHDPSGEVDAATVVRTISDFDQLCQLGKGAAKALKELSDAYPREILLALNTWEGANEDTITSEVSVSALIEGMTNENDITTTSGNLLVQAGTDLTETTIQRIRNFANSQGVEQPITVSTRRA